MVHQTAPLAVDRRADAAAAVVAHHHDVLHLQHVDGELEHGQIVGVLGRGEIGDVAVHEQLARIEVHDLVGGHAAVGAADPQILRRLLPLEALEEAGIGRDFAFGPGAIVAFR